MKHLNQCCGSGSVCFLAIQIQIHQHEVGMDPDPSIMRQKKNFFYVFLYLKNDVNVASKSSKQKTQKKNNFQLWHLKIYFFILKDTEESRRIQIRSRIRIRIRQSEVRIRNTDLNTNQLGCQGCGVSGLENLPSPLPFFPVSGPLLKFSDDISACFLIICLHLVQNVGTTFFSQIPIVLGQLQVQNTNQAGFF